MGTVLVVGALSLLVGFAFWVYQNEGESPKKGWPHFFIWVGSVLLAVVLTWAVVMINFGPRHPLKIPAEKKLYIVPWGDINGLVLSVRKDSTGASMLVVKKFTAGYTIQAKDIPPQEEK